MQLFLIHCGMASSVKPDQTTPQEQSDQGLQSALLADAIFLRNFGVCNFRAFTVVYLE